METTIHRRKNCLPNCNPWQQYTYSVLRSIFASTQAQIQYLENELNEWKMRDTSETQYWERRIRDFKQNTKNMLKDSTKRIDEKFDRIMFYLEESRRSSNQSMELSTEIQPQN